MTEVSFKALVQRADRDWSRETVRPIAYEFSNGREFRVTERPGEPYAWTTGTST